jgi:hypothetical protein
MCAANGSPGGGTAHSDRRPMCGPASAAEYVSAVASCDPRWQRPAILAQVDDAPGARRGLLDTRVATPACSFQRCRYGLGITLFPCYGRGAIWSQKPQLWMAPIWEMGMTWLSPAGASSISAFEWLNSGQTGAPWVVGLPVRAKVVTYATS